MDLFAAAAAAASRDFTIRVCRESTICVRSSPRYVLNCFVNSRIVRTFLSMRWIDSDNVLRFVVVSAAEEYAS